MKRFYLITCFLFIFLTVWSQGSKRYWNYHLSNIKTFDVVQGNKKIYFLSEGGIYFFNEADNSVQTLTKIDGLSGSDFQGIDYNITTNSLVITYKNSMVDVVTSDGTIYPFPDIKRKNISGNKSIYNATSHNEFCYLSCGFGIVVIDLIKLEIKDSFIIGDEGKYQPVYDIAVDTAGIYAATESGLKYASLNSSNLLDFSNWSIVENKFLEGYNFHLLTQNNNRIWAIHKAEEGVWHGDKMFSRHGVDTWYPEFTETGVVHNVTFYGDKTVLSSINGVQVFQSGTTESLHIEKYPFMRDSLEMFAKSAITDSKGDVWIADYNYGAIRYTNGNFEQLTPDGPIDNDAFALNYSNNKLWVSGGGRTLSWDNLRKGFIIQSLSDGEWEYINSTNHPELEGKFDVVEILPTLSDPDHIYVATWGGGLFEFKDGVLQNNYTEQNSTLQNITLGSYYVRIGGLDFDSNGNLWMSNSEVESCLHVLRANNSWQAYATPEIAGAYKIGGVLVDDNDNIWTFIPRDKTYGLYIMSNDGKQKKHLNVISYFSNVDVEIFPEMNNVYCFAKDKAGAIWVGTSKGVTVYSDPENVFLKEPYYATQPGVDENDGIYHPLLENETVTAIAVDGGNRKWCGTKSSGIYLISEDGTQELEHFNTENSDLISDGIISLEYDGDHGILYVGTQLGLVSFHTQSRNAFSYFKNVYAYPNPVRSNYEGDVYITGLMEESNVKITTVSGRLVYETTSLGGQAVWSGKDLDGNRVATGVYLVLCASSDGQESAITKILFIR